MQGEFFLPTPLKGHPFSQPRSCPPSDAECQRPPKTWVWVSRSVSHSIHSISQNRPTVLTQQMEMLQKETLQPTSLVASTPPPHRHPWPAGVRPLGWGKRRVTPIDDRDRWRKCCVQPPPYLPSVTNAPARKVPYSSLSNKPHNITNPCKITMRLLHSMNIQMRVWLLFFKATRLFVSF